MNKAWAEKNKEIQKPLSNKATLKLKIKALVTLFGYRITIIIERIHRKISK